MISVKFPQSNFALAEDEPEYETLHVHADTTIPQVPLTCCFELNKEEIDDIVRTGKIYHTQWTFGNPFQPILMSTQNPFINLEDQSSKK
jgi:hypothetical protein